MKEDTTKDTSFTRGCLGGVHGENIAFDLTKEDIKAFEKITNSRIYSFYCKNEPLFKATGIDFEDLKSLSSCYLASFLSNREIPEADALMGDLVDSDQYTGVDMAHFSLFLKQRLISLIRLLAQKRKDIDGNYSRYVIYRVGDSCTLQNMSRLSWITQKEAKALGLYKVTGDLLLEINKNAKNIAGNAFFGFNSCTYFKHRLMLKRETKDFLEPASDDVGFLKDRFNNLPMCKRKFLIKKFLKSRGKAMSEEYILAEKIAENPVL